VTGATSGRLAVASPADRAYAAGMEPVRAVSVDDVARARPEYWSQETIAEANGSLFKAAKGVGSTAWHAHDDQDEVFLVTHGTLIVELRTGDVAAHAGELLVVPRGVEHRPRADDEVRFLIVGTSVTSNAAGGKPSWSAEGGTPDVA
jgi:mannose-6-phosphate isomerase-like protein (cupin superfamily)